MSFVKWAGGKRKLAPMIVERLLAKGPAQVYFEPFVGSGAVFFHLCTRPQEERPESVYLSDTNEDLMCAYRALRTEFPRLVKYLADLQEQVSQADFLRVRDEWQPTDYVERGARFIYLNKTCFNGLFRVNAAGRFNVSWGKREAPTVLDLAALEVCSKALQHAVLSTEPYEAILATITGTSRRSIVYLDPPYLPSSKTANFTSYTSERFGVDDHRALATFARQLLAAGARFVLSESDNPLIRELFEGWCTIEEVEASRSISRDGSTRGKVRELLITGEP